jgi:RHS repeat-associated protein
MLIDSFQGIVAKYLYDAFGNMISKSGLLANANVYRFSSKEWHQNSGLVYYLCRYYDPNLQRWPIRDPIGEGGGKNLYAFVGNQELLCSWTCSGSSVPRRSDRTAVARSSTVQTTVRAIRDVIQKKALGHI